MSITLEWKLAVASPWSNQVILQETMASALANSLDETYECGSWAALMAFNITMAALLCRAEDRGYERGADPGYWEGIP